MCSVLLVATALLAPLVRLVKVAPLLVETCHWMVSGWQFGAIVPSATLSLHDALPISVWLDGWVAITGSASQVLSCRKAALMLGVVSPAVTFTRLASFSCVC